jgi:hypothetical protein
LKRRTHQETRENVDGAISEDDTTKRGATKLGKDLETGTRVTGGVIETLPIRNVNAENTQAIRSRQGQIEKRNDGARKLVREEGSLRKSPSMEESPRNRERLPMKDEPGDSSDSPIDEWDRLYSSDDTTHSIQKELDNAMRRKSRCEHDMGEGITSDSTESEDSDGNQLPTPWSAVCIVGVRVYSKDEDLKLETIFGDNDVRRAK